MKIEDITNLENYMVMPQYETDYDPEYEKEKYEYLCDMRIEDMKNKSLGI